MPHAVLNEDWSDYDNRKKLGEDRRYFACTESWEVDYLIRKLKRHYPGKSEQQIRAAIEACCSRVGAPHPREKFVDCVTARLGS